MWRRVTSQSPDQAGGETMRYKLAFAAMSDLLTEGNSLSGRERNSLFLHSGLRLDGQPHPMANASTATGFAYEDDTRGVVTVDWDFDGDLDVWLTNRTGPRLRLLRNELESDNAWVAFQLEGVRSNRDAIGARVTLVTASGRTLVRSRRAGEGFLSQNSSWLHFGLGQETEPVQVTIAWPDGASQKLENLSVNAFWVVRQGGAALPRTPKVGAPLPATVASGEAWKPEARTVLVSRLPLPEIRGEVLRKGTEPGLNRAQGKLWVFFAPWCQPCLKEMAALVAQAEAFRAQGIEVHALEVPGVDAPADSAASLTNRVLDKLKWPYPVTRLNAEEAGALDVFHRSFLSLRRALPLPASFLCDAEGRLAVVYRGPVGAAQVLEDRKLLSASVETVRQQHLPFQGRWHAQTPKADVTAALVAWKREGYLAQGQAYLERFLPLERQRLGNEAGARNQLALLCEHLADFYRLRQDPRYPRAYEMALEIHPGYVPALSALGNHYGQKGDIDRALSYYERAVKLAPGDPQALMGLGVALAKKRAYAEARRQFARLVEIEPDHLQARMYLCQMHLELEDWRRAGGEIRILWRALPGQRQVADLVQRLRPHLGPEEEARLKADLNAVLRARNQRQPSE